MVLTKTTEAGIQSLIFLALQNSSNPISPRRIAERLDLSPTYLAKISSLMVKANILRSHKGALGGVTLNRPPDQITLLSIIEACQGQLAGDFCSGASEMTRACGFHRAMQEIHEKNVEVFSKWTLQDLADRPCPSASIEGKVDCWMKSAHNAGESK